MGEEVERGKWEKWVGLLMALRTAVYIYSRILPG